MKKIEVNGVMYEVVKEVRDAIDVVVLEIILMILITL